MLKNKKGLTLIELIIAIVISSIVFTLVAYFFTKFINTSNQIKKEEKRIFEQHLIVDILEGFENNINLKGQALYVDTLGTYLYSLDEYNTLDKSISLNIHEKEINYNGKTIKLETVNNINLKTEQTNKKIIYFTIVFDNDTTYNFNIYIIGGILSSEENLWKESFVILFS